jgi:hypothetical protein
MNQYFNFEDSVFILHMRVRLLRDMLCLDPDPGLFLGKSMDDLEFINSVMESLTANIIENAQLAVRNGDIDRISDLEWQFNQLLTEFSGDASPFSGERFPDTRRKIAALKISSDTRRKAIDEFAFPAELALTEPVVSSTEMSELLRGF